MRTYTREAELGKPDAKLRAVPVVLSTEHPVDRGDHTEILDHAPGAVDLSRAPLPLIESHDTGKLNVGIVDRLHLDGRKLRGLAVFGKSARASEILADVEAGIVRSLSIGYERFDGRPDPKNPDVVRFKFKPYEA